MLLNFDAAQLEWRAIAHLSGDAVALAEINGGFDTHTDNQVRFKFPGWQNPKNGSEEARIGRLTAKIFLFRTIYCPLSIIDRTAYAFSVDNDFKDVGGVKFWTKAIEAFYDKYSGIVEYHNNLIRTAQTDGKIVSETGRVYHIEPRMAKGEWRWPVSDIANYPVQGFSADLMSLARVSAFRRINQYKEENKKPNILFVNTVHDSIVLDCGYDMRTAMEVGAIMKGVFRDIQNNFERIYRKKLLAPMDCDMKVGVNWLWQHSIKI